MPVVPVLHSRLICFLFQKNRTGREHLLKQSKNNYQPPPQLYTDAEKTYLIDIHPMILSVNSCWPCYPGPVINITLFCCKKIHKFINSNEADGPYNRLDKVMPDFVM